MKAISLWQPWASLAVSGAKQFETRSWFTNWRGTLLIHAAKKFDSVQWQVCLEDYFKENLAEIGIHEPSQMPLGCLVGVVTIEEIFKTEDIVHKLSDRQIAFGDFSSGRFAWKLTDVRMFRNPIPMRGKQGIWTLTDTEQEKVRRNQ